MAVDTAGNVYVADFGNNLIRKITITTDSTGSSAGLSTFGLHVMTDIDDDVDGTTSLVLPFATGLPTDATTGFLSNPAYPAHS